jgi:hypothetical protein
MGATILMVGTRKGLWLGRSDEARRDWEWTGPLCDMEEVYSACIDKRGVSPRLFAGPSSSWTGPRLLRSDDLGASWQEAKIGFPADTGASLERVWQIAPGAEQQTVWAGTEPGAVFRSLDGGATFELERGLWEHPHREEWGAGYGGQAFHTVVPHPSDPDSVVAAISSGGVYATTDGGQSWTAQNTGVQAEFLPEGQQYPEFGQCVHKVARHPSPSPSAPGPHWPGCGSSSRRRPSRTWSGRAPSPPRCSGRRTAAPPTPWSTACGTTPPGPSGSPAAAACASTP